MTRREFVLIGYPLGHSFSQRYFTEKFEMELISDCSYSKCELESIDMLPHMIAQNPNLCGFNVTIPYKEQVIQYLDSIESQAQQIGAVNCVRIKDGKLRGYNTDAYGFRNSLLALISDERPSALVLGTGGASKAIAYVLKELDISYKMVSRTAAKGRYTYTDLDKQVLDAHKLIINTTPLGTFPNIDASPDLPYEYLSDTHFLFDVVYNPAVSQFLSRGASQGARTLNGHRMLIDQAEKSWEIWNEK